MSNTEFIGYLIVFAVPVLGSLVALVKPIINLNVNIQKLSDSITHLNSDKKEMKNQLNEHEEKLNDHETRLLIMEHDRGGRKNE